MEHAVKPFCFVLMPFEEEFDDRYSLGIKGACTEVGIYCERVDEQIFDGSILDRIYNQIAKSDIIVADMSGRSANVFYEVGYAHALKKQVILITSNAEDIPFDLKHYPHIVYGKRIENLKTSLKKSLSKLAFGDSSAKEYELGLQLYWKNKALTETALEIQHDAGTIPNADLTVHNNSGLTYQSGEFRIAVESPAEYSVTRSSAEISTELPNGRWLHMLPEMGKLFPGCYLSIYFAIDSRTHNPHGSVEVTIKIFSDAGIREFPVILRNADPCDDGA